MNHDTSRTGIECGPAGPPVGSWEDDQQGDRCSLCLGAGWLEPPTGPDMDCPNCQGEGVAL